MGCPEMLVRNYHYSLHNNPVGHSSLVITYPVMLNYLSQKWKAWHETLEIMSTECPMEVYTIHLAGLALS